MTSDDLKKFKLVDQVLGSLSLDEIKSIFSSDLIIDKLKGVDNGPGPIASAFRELGVLRVEIMNLRIDHGMLKEDFKAALKAINTISQPVMPIALYSAELSTLKSKYSVY